MLPRREVTAKYLKKPLHPCRFHPVRHISISFSESCVGIRHKHTQFYRFHSENHGFAAI